MTFRCVLLYLFISATAFGQCLWIYNPFTRKLDCTSNVTTAAGVVALFSGCSGTQYLGADGACHVSSGPPTGAAGGTLAGIYPNPTLRDFVSVKDYIPASQPDGTTDNRTGINNAIAAAVAAGKSVYFPGSATCYMTSGVLNVTGQTTLYGDGQNSCIKLANASNSHVFNVTGSGVTFEKLLIDGNQANQSTGLYQGINVATGLSNFTIRNTTAQNAQGSCVYMLSTSSVLITGSVFSGCMGNGATGNEIFYDTTTATTPSNITIANNTITAPTTGFIYGIGVAAQGTATITGINISNNNISYPFVAAVETGGMYLADSGSSTPHIFNAVVNGNTITATGSPTGNGAGIEFKGVDRSVITGNVIYGANKGILDEICTLCVGGNSITGNTIIESSLTAGVGIFLLSKTKDTVVGNTIYLTGGVASGIGVQDSSQIQIEANKVSANATGGGYGIYTNNSTATNIDIRGNRISGTSYGHVFFAATHTAVNLSGEVCDTTAAACYLQTIPAGISILDDNIGLSILGQPSTTGNIPTCRRYTLSNNGTNWTIGVNGNTGVAGIAIPAATTSTPTLFALPAKGIIIGIREKTTAAWSGTGFTTMTVSVGDSVGGNSFYTAASYDMFAAVSNTNFRNTSLFKSASDAGTNVQVLITGNQNLNANTITGVTDIEVCWVTLP